LHRAFQQDAEKGLNIIASQTITFRPSIAPETLEREAKRLHFKDRTELINAAIMAMLTDSDKLRSSKHIDVGSKSIPDSARHHLLMNHFEGYL
jgi:hypothetical protein